MKAVSYVFILLGICSCTANENRTVTYKQLPTDVRDKFNYVYDYMKSPTIGDNGDTIAWYSPPFAECYNLKKDCTCEIKTEGGIIRNPVFVIKSCDKKTKISWEILQRVFIIKNDSIYFPSTKEGVTTTGKPRSFDIKIDTVNFYVHKLK